MLDKANEAEKNEPAALCPTRQFNLKQPWIIAILSLPKAPLIGAAQPEIQTVRSASGRRNGGTVRNLTRRLSCILICAGIGYGNGRSNLSRA
jgi:hypothetical protein